MTTYIPFNPSPTAIPPFAFKAILNGVNYSLTVTWNLSGQRWYLNIFTLQGVPQLSVAMVGSPPDYDINLINGFFGASSIVYRVASNQLEISP